VNIHSIFTPCNLNGLPLIACVDTGANISILNLQFAKKNNFEIIPQKINLQQTFKGHNTEIQGMVTNARLENGDKTILLPELYIGNLAVQKI